MFKDIFLFELKYRLRRPATYIYFVVLMLVGILYGAILAGAAGSQPASQFTGGGNNLANSPIVLHQLILALTQIAGTFIIAAFMAVPIYRDFRYEMHSLLYTKPISKFSYLSGRFSASFLIMLVVLLGLGVGVILAMHYPDYANPPKLGPFNLWHYLNPYLINVLPYAFFTGAIFFATVSLTRNEYFIYLNAILILVLFSVASGILSTVDNKLIGSLLDPTGGAAFANTVEYWTVFERNNQTIGLSGPVLFNLLIWLAVGIGILVFTYRSFTLTHAKPELIGRKSTLTEKSPSIFDTLSLRKVNLPKVSQRFDFGASLSLLKRLYFREIKSILRSPIFLVILGVAALFVIIGLAFGNQAAPYGIGSLPVT
ncbi:MAG: hypothetical protein AAF206_14830 [Bacteroidota bacterium]